MRVFHTADWHLDRRRQAGHDRHDEHRRFLHWLTTTIAAQRVEVLIVAGDVFDTGNPPGAALVPYYAFLGAAGPGLPRRGGGGRQPRPPGQSSRKWDFGSLPVPRYL